ncbi:MAG: hypothetical protein Q8L55_03380 [Phycisphaerales bacterium]|nr:hypothetical protein [Phycisphaerales bacterium]
MTRTQLEHILRAAAGITGADQFIVIGSQSILGPFPSAPQELTRSIEADLFTLRSPADADLIEGTIGEGSPFHSTFGYHAHGVGIESAVLPSGWQQRLVQVRTPATAGATGLCLDVHDLAVSKLVAGREKDLDFLAALFTHRLADPAVVRSRLDSTVVAAEVRAVSEQRLTRLSKN